MSSYHFDVAVVGYGPTGMTMASLLGQMGHQVVVIERWPTLYGRPRLTHIDGETARLLSFSCDIEDALRDSSSIQSFKFYNAKEQELLDVAAIPSIPMGHPAHISIHQPDIETALDNRIRSYPNVTVMQGTQVTAIAQASDRVILTLKRGDEVSTLNARYVYGADGARSLVREASGIQRDDFGFNERWLNIDGERKRPLPEIFRHTRQYCDPARGHMHIPIGERRQRFEFAILKDELTETMEKPETGWRILKDYHNIGPDDISIIRQIVYTFECRLAKTWRKDRVLLGGDAAHTMPPYLGQGACSGIRDSANLAWKLDLVLRGKAPDTLLDTYEKERREHVTYIMKTACAFGKVANTHSRVAAFFRDIILRNKLAPKPKPFPSIVEGVVQKDVAGAGRKVIGRVPPQGKVTVAGATTLLDDVTGYRFALIARRNPSAFLTENQKSILNALGCKILTLGGDGDAATENLSDTEGVYGEFLASTGQFAMLTRPDTNLFGIAATSGEIGSLVDQLHACLV